MVMSNDLVLMEMHEDGPATDITNMVSMANTTGMDAKEALDATRHTCANCGYAAKGYSEVILKDVTEKGHVYWCRKCYSNSCKDDAEDQRARRSADGDDMELPYNQFKRDKGSNEGRAHITLKGMKKTVLGNLAKKYFGDRTAGSLARLKKQLSSGLDKKALEDYGAMVTTIAAKGTITAELRNMVAGADYMPMVSETVSYRYSCRRMDCRFIPMKETQWVIGHSKEGTGKRAMWFCPACGREYKHRIHDRPEDDIGQDLNFNYVIFMQFEVKGGMHTFCAMAAAPGGYLNNLLGTLKLILANKKHSFNRGAQVAITDLMTVSNNMFVEAMKNFPKKTLVVKHPTHH